MKFTVIIPSRNRPALFREAMNSVLMQRNVDLEIVAVNDGSDEEHLAAYRAMEASLEGKARFINLRHTSRGHGHSYTLNLGAVNASGDYLCFLDDDDSFTDPDHLARAERVISASSHPVDLYFANQHAYARGVRVDKSIWIDDLLEHSVARPPVDSAGGYTVGADDLLKCAGFAHLNTTVIRREYFERIGGLDEGLRYECDRDFFLRAIDQARLIKYHPAFVARHNIPDPLLKLNVSTSLNDLEKRIFQLRALDKAILFSKQRSVKAFARRQKVYTLKRIAEELAIGGRYRTASYYALEALLIGFGWRWLSFTAWISWQKMVQRDRDVVGDTASTRLQWLARRD